VRLRPHDGITIVESQQQRYTFSHVQPCARKFFQALGKHSSMSSVLERLFCKDLIEDKEWLQENVDKLNDANSKQVEQIQELTDSNRQLERENQQLTSELTSAGMQIKELNADIEFYLNRIDALEGMLEAAIQIPDVTDLVPPGIEKALVKPYEHPEFIREEPNRPKRVYNVVCGDLEYWGLPKATWIDLIDRIRPVVREAHGWPDVPVNDCENWAASMSNFMANALRKTELDKQGALFIAWSPLHAYCGFVDSELRVWIFDPMGGPDYMRGELGVDAFPDKYDTRSVWFTG